LSGWIPGLDADFVIAVPDEAAIAAYQHLSNVRATVTDDPRQLAELALRHFGPPLSPAAITEQADDTSQKPQQAEPRSGGAAVRLDRPAVADPFELISRAEPIELGPELNGGLDKQDAFGARTEPAQARPTPGPLQPRVTAALSENQGRAVPGPTRGGLGPRQILDRLGQGRRAPVGAELGQAVLACKPIVAAVVSR